MSDQDKLKTCSICGGKYRGWGHNAWPVKDGRCCEACNWTCVIPERLRRTAKQTEQPKEAK